MEKQIKVLITGATGKSSGAAIDELLKMGYPVRAMVHSIENVQKRSWRKVSRLWQATCSTSTISLLR